MQAKNTLLVTTAELEAIRHWPLELRALFDPRAAWTLIERAASKCERDQIERRRLECERRADSELPF
jgi:hypothetical protein